MKRSIRTCCAVFALLLAAPAFAQEDAVKRAFDGGEGAASAGIVEASEDTETAGPQAIAAGDDGEVYLLDQINNRVLRFDPDDSAKPPQIITLPDGLEPTDIIVRDGKVLLWDGEIHEMEITGSADAPTRGLTRTRSVAPPDEFARSAFAQMGSEPVELTDAAAEVTRALRNPVAPARGRQYVASRGKGAVVAELSPLEGDSGVSIELRPKGGGNVLAKLKLQVASRLGAAEVLEIDRKGRIFVMAENVPNSTGDAASSFVARYSPAGVLEGVHELPLTSAVALSRRFVTVSPDGDVYFLRTQNAKVDVLGVGFRVMKNGVIDLAGRSASSSSSSPSLASLIPQKGSRAAVRPLTRAQVLETGYAFANIKWKVPASAYGSDPDRGCSGFNRIRRPGYMHGKLNQEVQGVPYCWGCQGFLPQFAANVERGMLAGNVCTRDDPRRDVAGVDCSSFVSATWGLSTHFTTIAIPSIAKELSNPWDLLPGDALNKAGSHVMLFAGFTPDKKVKVIEATPGACNGRVCASIYPLGSLLARGYRPVRYRGLAGETSAAAAPPAPPAGKTPPAKAPAKP